MVRKKSDLELLWEAYKETGGAELRNYLIEYYRYMVRHQAERLAATMPAFIDVDDLESMGVFGLIEAIDRFNLKLKVKFEAYAPFRIRGSILDQLRTADWIPRLTHSKAKEMKKVSDQLRQELGRDPTSDDMAQRLNLTPERYATLAAEASATAIISFSDEWEDEEGKPDNRILARLSDDADTDAAFRTALLKTVTVLLQSMLTEKERTIVNLYYYDGLNMREISKLFGVTESRICQIHSVIIRRLHEALKTRKEELFV